MAGCERVCSIEDMDPGGSMESSMEGSDEGSVEGSLEGSSKSSMECEQVRSIEGM